MKQPQKILVTGGTGFLGSHLIQRLQREGFEVHAQGRDAKIGEILKKNGVTFWQGDLSDSKFVDSLPTHMDFVVHCAALSSPWGRYKSFYTSNVLATEKLSHHYLKANLKRFVHISSPSLYVDTKDRLNVHETDSLPRVEMNHYMRTKKMAETKIDQAAKAGLPAVTLRPQGIVGPGDRAIFPRILRTAKKGFVPRIGSKPTLIDLTYVENVVDAILLAARSQDHCIGRKYNISNGEPVDLYQLIQQLMSLLDISFRWKKLPFGMAYRMAGLMEFACRTVFRNTEPLLTRYSVCVLGVSRTLNIDAARKDLGYEPRVSLNHALKVVAQDLKQSGVV